MSGLARIDHGIRFTHIGVPMIIFAIAFDVNDEE